MENKIVYICASVHCNTRLLLIQTNKHRNTPNTRKKIRILKIQPKTMKLSLLTVLLFMPQWQPSLWLKSCYLLLPPESDRWHIRSAVLAKECRASCQRLLQCKTPALERNARLTAQKLRKRHCLPRTTTPPPKKQFKSDSGMLINPLFKHQLSVHLHKFCPGAHIGGDIVEVRLWGEEWA